MVCLLAKFHFHGSIILSNGLSSRYDYDQLLKQYNNDKSQYQPPKKKQKPQQQIINNTYQQKPHQYPQDVSFRTPSTGPPSGWQSGLSPTNGKPVYFWR